MREEGRNLGLYLINEQIVVCSEMKEIDFDFLIDYEKPEVKKADTSGNVTKKKTGEEFKENVLQKVLKKVKVGFSYILSWGL